MMSLSSRSGLNHYPTIIVRMKAACNFRQGGFCDAERIGFEARPVTLRIWRSLG